MPNCYLTDQGDRNFILAQAYLTYLVAIFNEYFKLPLVWRNGNTLGSSVLHSTCACAQNLAHHCKKNSKLSWRWSNLWNCCWHQCTCVPIDNSLYCINYCTNPIFRVICCCSSSSLYLKLLNSRPMSLWTNFHQRYYGESLLKALSNYIDN